MYAYMSGYLYGSKCKRESFKVTHQQILLESERGADWRSGTYHFSSTCFCTDQGDPIFLLPSENIFTNQKITFNVSKKQYEAEKNDNSFIEL